MRGFLDFSSWQGVLSTLAGLVLVSAVAIGMRLLLMQRVQTRREQQNRQINERLKTLISAYKVLGGSFTGDLVVDPRHLRELRRHQEAAGDNTAVPAVWNETIAERNRRTRDAVEAALSDIILLGTEEQVRLAAQAAQDMVEGRVIETADLVRSLREFIREVLDLAPIPSEVVIPAQGPTRPAVSGARGAGGGRGPEGAGGGRGGGGGGSGGVGGGGGPHLVAGGSAADDVLR